MDDFKRIQRSIEFIEENLQEELHINAIAAKACFSAFHFQRLFQAISGFSVHEYIRKRRLSEAAEELKQTDRSVLDISIAYGYGSQEAFTRAFDGYFGITPAKYRKSESAFRRQHKINFSVYRSEDKGDLAMHIPEIKHLDSIHTVCFEYRTSLEDNRHINEITGFYHDFGKNRYYERIPGKTAPNMAYGISCDFRDDGGFSFLVGEEAKRSGEMLEEGFVRFDIPGGTYAVFQAFGSDGLVQQTRTYIYGTWLPNSNYERREGPDFEVTDVMRSSFPDFLRITVYIPVRHRSDERQRE